MSGGLQEIDVVPRELPIPRAVDLENAEWSIGAPNDDVDRAIDSMLDQQLRETEALRARLIIRDHRLAGMQRIARRRIEPGRDFSDADDLRLPTDAGKDEELLLRGQELQHFCKAGAKTGRDEATGLLQHRQDVAVL